MKQSLHKRLGRLEIVSAATRRARESSANQSGLATWLRETRETPRLHGIEQRPDESFASTFARTLGISDTELDRRLRSGSLGVAC